MNATNFSNDLSFKNVSYASLNTTVPVNYNDAYGITVRIIINLIGVVGNILLLLACFQQQKIQPSSVNCLIIQLSGFWLFESGFYYFPYNFVKLADLFGLITVPAGFCPTLMTVGNIFVIFGSCMEIAVALNRLCAVWLPVHYRAISTPKVTAGISFFSAGMGFCGLLPLYGIHSRYVALKNNGACMIVSTGRVGGIVTLVSSVGPIAVTGVCYGLLFGKILYIIRKQRRTTLAQQDKPEDGQKQTSLSMHRRIQISIALLGAFGCSMVCTLPYYFVVLAASSASDISITMATWMVTIFVSKYSVVPYVMIWMSTDYKGIVKKIISRKDVSSLSAQPTDRMSSATPARTEKAITRPEIDRSLV